MTFEEFEDLVAQAVRKRGPLLQEEAPATDLDIASAERELGRKLPDDYRRFLQRHGGGHFHFALMFSAAPDSEWNVAKHQGWVKKRPGFLAISDDQCGGFHGYADGSGRIFYWYPTEQEPPIVTHAGLFDFLAEVALRIS